MATNDNTDKVAHEETPVVTTNITVPEPLWKSVRNLATDRRCSAQAIWIEAMTEYLDRLTEASAA